MDSAHQQFNKMAIEFLTEMEKAFPQENKIKTYKHKFEFVKSMNNKKPVEIFMENLKPFGRQILSKDENFFKKDEYVNNVENMSGKIGLVDYWDSMSAYTRQRIWEYMTRLYVLGMMSLGFAEELNEIQNSLL